MSSIKLATALLATVAPAFLRNLRREDISEKYAKRVIKYVDSNIRPVKTDEDVKEVADIVRQDPVQFEGFMEMLLEAERQLVEMHISDVQHAREHNRTAAESRQAFVLLVLSFASIICIAFFLMWMVLAPPKLSDGGPNRDLVIQISGAAIGFLTGIGGMFARNISSAFDYWFGSSAGSKDKSDQIDKIIQRIEVKPSPLEEEGQQEQVSSGASASVPDDLETLRANFQKLMKQPVSS